MAPSDSRVPPLIRLRSTHFVLLSACSLLASGCGSSPHLLTWRDADFRGEPFRKLYLVVLLENREAARVMEEALQTGLEAAGTAAVLSHVQKSPNRSPFAPRHELFLDSLRCDGVLLVTYTRPERYTTPGTKHPVAGATRAAGSDSLRAPFPSAETRSFVPGPSSGIDLSLTRRPEGDTVWTARLDTMAEKELAARAEELSHLVLNELTREHLIGAMRRDGASPVAPAPSPPP